MLIFIHHSVNPYRVAFFNALAKSGVRFKVYFLSLPAKNRKWKVEDFDLQFEYQFFQGRKIYVPGNDHSYFQLNFDIWKQLLLDNPDRVITIGWNYSAAFIAAFFCRKHAKQFIVWSESTTYERSIQRTLTLPFVKLLLQQTSHCIAAGTRAKEYLEQLGVDANKVTIAYYTVFTKKFIQESRKIYTKKLHSILRKKLKIAPTSCMVLYVGQLIERKGMNELLNVIRTMKKKEQVIFVVVGYGPFAEIFQQEKCNNLKVIPFVPNDQIMQYFTACDLFILPSLEETWGLVVNEAMCAAKPILVSQYAGCSEDLVQHDLNGFVIDPAMTSDIVKKIQYIANHVKIRKKMGTASLSIIKEINLKQNIKVIQSIIKSQ